MGPTQSPPQLPPPPFSTPARHASFEELLNVSYWLWRLNPSVTVPAMLGSALDVVRQSAVLLIFMATISSLASEGILGQLAESLKGGDPFALLRAIASPQLLPAVMLAVAASVALFYLISIVGGGFVNSAEYGSYLQLLRTGNISVSAVVVKAGRRWNEMALAVMVTEAVKYGPLIFVSMLIASTSAAKVVSEGSAALLPQMLPSLVTLFAVGIFTACMVVLTTYAYPAVANGASWHAAIGQSIAACWMFPGETVLYMFLRALSAIAVASLSLLAGLLSVQVSSLLTTLASFVVVPVLHTLKAAIFIRREPVPVVIPILPGPPLIRDAPRHILSMSSQRIGIGIRELSNFVLSAQNIPFHALSTATFIIGIIAGLQVSSSGLSALLRALGYETGRANPAFQGLALPFLAADISFHNWQVSLATALSGLALIIPPFVTMMFNGFILGVVGSLVPNTTMLLAAILPHGIIELPSFITAGSVGLSLAFRFTKALIKGKATTDDGVHSAVKRAIYVIIGLAPFFIMAGIIEALVTPFIMRYYGWG